MLKKLASHAAAFLASFAIAYGAVTTFWLLPFILTVPDIPGIRDGMLRIAFVHPIGQGVLAAAGAALALLPFRRRLREWNIVSVSRTAIVGGLAGAISAPSIHVMFWLSRTIDVPVGTKGYVAFPIICGAISSLALFFPWMTAGPQTAEKPGGKLDRLLGLPPLPDVAPAASKAAKSTARTV